MNSKQTTSTSAAMQPMTTPVEMQALADPIAPAVVVDGQQNMPPPAYMNGPPPTEQPTGRYRTAVPLYNLQKAPTPVDCPSCGQRAVTRIDYESGNTTHLWAAVLCLFCCLGCIPYLVNSMKDVSHRCGNCNILLATWHNSGGVDVYVQPPAVHQQYHGPGLGVESAPGPVTYR